MNHESSTAAQVKTFKFLEDKVKTVQAASSRRRRHPTPRNNSVALEYLCLDYVGGCTLSRVVRLAPEAVAKTFYPMARHGPDHSIGR